VRSPRGNCGRPVRMRRGDRGYLQEVSAARGLPSGALGDAVARGRHLSSGTLGPNAVHGPTAAAGGVPAAPASTRAFTRGRATARRGCPAEHQRRTAADHGAARASVEAAAAGIAPDRDELPRPGPDGPGAARLPEGGQPGEQGPCPHRRACCDVEVRTAGKSYRVCHLLAGAPVEGRRGFSGTWR